MAASTKPFQINPLFSMTYRNYKELIPTQTRSQTAEVVCLSLFTEVPPFYIIYTLLLKREREEYVSIYTRAGGRGLPPVTENDKRNPFGIIN